MSESKYGEPWHKIEKQGIRTSSELFLGDAYPLPAKRIVSCVNALSGIASPEELVKAARDYQRLFAIAQDPDWSKPSRSKALRESGDALSRLRAAIGGSGDEWEVPSDKKTEDELTAEYVLKIHKIRIEELEKDQERLDWYQANPLTVVRSDDPSLGWFASDGIYRETLREAIDAAMKGGEDG